MSTRNSFIIVAALALTTPAWAQERQFDPNGSVKFNLPADSPVTLISCDVNESRATVRGGAWSAGSVNACVRRAGLLEAGLRAA